MVNSCEKGKRGEREWAKFCRACGFTGCRRGQQHSGIEGEDVVGIPGIHQEVKREQKLNIDEAMAQSIRDANGDDIPVVFHRKNLERSKEGKAQFYRGWKATLRVEDFINSRLYSGTEKIISYSTSESKCLNLDKALAQSIRDAHTNGIPAVYHRKNVKQSEEDSERFYRGWKVTMRAEDFLALWRKTE